VFRALINYGLEFLNDREYVPLQTPQLMLRDQMAKTAQLSQYVLIATPSARIALTRNQVR
jgi:seryl-tRNA synthetase